MEIQKTNKQTIRNSKDIWKYKNETNDTNQKIKTIKRKELYIQIIKRKNKKTNSKVNQHLYIPSDILSIKIVWYKFVLLLNI
jgi:hypothetical protein